MTPPRIWSSKLKIATYFGFHICSAIHSSGLFLIVAVAVGRGIREFDKVRSFSNPVRDSALRNSRFSLSFLDWVLLDRVERRVLFSRVDLK